MAQKPVLRDEVGCAFVAREVSVERGDMGERGCASEQRLRRSHFIQTMGKSTEPNHGQPSFPESQRSAASHRTNLREPSASRERISAKAGSMVRKQSHLLEGYAAII